MNVPPGRFAALLLSGLILSGPSGSNAQNSAISAPQSDPELGQTIVLSPVNVSTRPIGCFGLSVRARQDGLLARVAEMTVLAVIPHSDADKQGLGPLTQILSIDGKDVSNFTASFDKGSDLNAKLIDRKKGDKITLEVLVLGAKRPKRVTLVEGRRIHEFPFESDSEVEPLRTVHVGISR
jgi:S1-C subfamily serine protease